MELLAYPQGFKLKNDQHQSIIFHQIGDGDLQIYTNYEYTPQTVGQITTEEFMDKHKLVFLEIPKSNDLYPVFIEFIDKFTKTDQVGVVNSDTLILVDGDTQNGAALKIKVIDSVVTLIFSTTDMVDKQGIRIRGHEGGYINNWTNIFDLFNELKIRANDSQRKRHL